MGYHIEFPCFRSRRDALSPKLASQISVTPPAQTYLCLLRKWGIPSHQVYPQTQCRALCRVPDHQFRGRKSNRILCIHTFSYSNHILIVEQVKNILPDKHLLSKNCSVTPECPITFLPIPSQHKTPDAASPPRGNF